MTALIGEAVEALGGQRQLAEELAKRGIVSPRTGQPYSAANVWAWTVGRVVPPSDVLLGVAQVAGLSVDEHLWEGASNDRRLRRRLARLESEVQHLARTVEDLATNLQRLLASSGGHR